MSNVSLSSAGGNSIVTDGGGPSLVIKGTASSLGCEDRSDATTIQFDNRGVRISDAAALTPPGFGQGASNPGSNADVTSIGARNNCAAPGGTCIGAGANVSGAANNSVCVGTNSSVTDNNAVCVGASSTVGGSNAVCVGTNSSVSAISNNAVCVGPNATVSNNNTVCIGSGVNVGGLRAISIGSGSGVNGSGPNAVCVGASSNANADSAVCVGANSSANNLGSVVVGANIASSGTHVVCVGRGATTTNNDSTAVGRLAVAGLRSTAVGFTATASASDSVAVGSVAKALGGNSTSIGHNINSTAPDLHCWGNSDSTAAVSEQSQSFWIGRQASGTFVPYICGNQSFTFTEGLVPFINPFLQSNGGGSDHFITPGEMACGFTFINNIANVTFRSIPTLAGASFFSSNFTTGMKGGLKTGGGGHLWICVGPSSNTTVNFEAGWSRRLMSGTTSAAAFALPASTNNLIVWWRTGASTATLALINQITNTWA